MKNFDKIMQYWLSYVAAIIALIALGFSLMRVITYEVTTETLVGILVAILGLLITLGIGLYVWNVIEWKSELKKLDELKDELSSNLKAFTTKFQTTATNL